MVTCPSCGAPVASNQRFCGACGADVQTAPATRGSPIAAGQSAPYAYSQPSSYAPTDTYIEPRKGNTGRILIAVVVLLLACCCAMACGLIALELYLNFGQSAPATPAPKPINLLPLIVNWIS